MNIMISAQLPILDYVGSQLLKTGKKLDKVGNVTLEVVAKAAQKDPTTVNLKHLKQTLDCIAQNSKLEIVA